MEEHSNWYVYKITYPNGKIYVGMDHSQLACPWGYVGSSYNKQLIDDCNEWRLSNKEWNLNQEILFESKTCTLKELRRIEHEKIIEYNSTNPLIGYNQRT
ncbi:MAG: hypothetical protein LBV67_12555 [Streptococcaceae bacterium]|jgi:hypothetical protein|nr:hypothetical protein [Streptococcaceae bacterium]